MCEACDAQARQAGISPALAAAAQRLEATMAGAKVSEYAWEILLGRQGGAVPWTETQRMLTCLELAAQNMGGGLRCDAA